MIEGDGGISADAAREARRVVVIGQSAFAPNMKNGGRRYVHDLVRWGSALSVLVGFALSMGSNPALYGATADMLARDIRALPRLSWMVGGLATGATILFLVFQTINPNSFVAAVRGDVDAVLTNRWVDLIAGILLLGLAAIVVAWIVRVRALPERQPKAPKQNVRLHNYFVIGFSSAFIGFTTLPIMYMTGRVVAGVSSDFVPRLLAYGIFLIALGAPFFLLAWVWSRFPRLAQKISGMYERVLRWDYRWLLAAFLGIAGLVSIGFAVFANR